MQANFGPLRRAATRSAGARPLIDRSAANTASNFCTAAKAIGEIAVLVLPRAFEKPCVCKSIAELALFIDVNAS
jgi:hypothetical protein